MRFGIYAEMQTPPGKSHSAMTWEILRQIEHADQVGFDVYSVIDHHFFQKFSISRILWRFLPLLRNTPSGFDFVWRCLLCRLKIRCGLRGRLPRPIF